VKKYELALQSATEFFEKWQTSDRNDRYKWKVFSGWHQELHQVSPSNSPVMELMHNTHEGTWGAARIFCVNFLLWSKWTENV
jgi:hypothetical protein